ncbi:alpha/beta hydrolase [Sabulibacter ruber]|uniref:alpha/beta hydrolase n=1 Tax=Sabulibacter ruber TaxID=2811901 RepID=UPI001A97C8A5|nr:alpha/beta hydrolase-fold protein [Sabulibacter ruber]
MKVSRNTYKTGRLAVTYRLPTAEQEAKTGTQPLGLDSLKDGLLYVPRAYSPGKPAALAVMLHGSGGNADQGMWLLQRYADAHNLILIAPVSRKYSWDIIASNNFGPDVIFIDQAITQVFAHYVIDPARIAIGGFSDGASYALCLGLTNGDLFTHIIAFSPGFAYNMESHGVPNIFISHGTKDGVLPIDSCSRRLVRNLRDQEVEPTYLEFEGEHEIPEHISRKAIDWFLKK